MIGFDERDADLASRAGRALCRVLLPVLGAYALFGLAQACTGCAPAIPLAAEGKAYREERIACREQNATCQGFVACMRRVEAAHGRTYAGRCEQ